MGNNNSAEKISRLQESENKLLSWGVEWFQETQMYKKRRASLIWKAYDVDITVPDHRRTNGECYNGHIHTVELRREGNEDSKEIPIVALHGYGAGIGHFYSMLPALANEWDGFVYSIDAFGCGLSSRPRWNLGYGENISVYNAESYFLDAFEAWREAQKIDKMVLFGHSLGGYLSVAYAERYPERVEHLILCSPVGIPKKPPEIHSNQRLPWYFRVARSAWGSGWSPYHLVRMIGSGLIEGYTQRRFRDATWINKNLLKDYMYHNWTAGNISGGGYAHATLLEPGAYARQPLASRLHDVALRVRAVSFIYGAEDWMSVNHAEQVRDSLYLSEYDQGVEIYEVQGGGHMMFIDNPLGLVDAILETTYKTKRGKTKRIKVIGHQYLAEDAIFRGLDQGVEVAARVSGNMAQGRVLAMDHGTGQAVVEWTDSSLPNLKIPFHELHLLKESSG